MTHIKIGDQEESIMNQLKKKFSEDGTVAVQDNDGKVNASRGPVKGRPGPEKDPHFPILPQALSSAQSL